MTNSTARSTFATLLALTACNALIDVKDLQLVPEGALTGDGAAGDGATGGDGAAGDASADAAPCNADTTKDPTNCGRCGHDCGKGTCAAGKCTAFELASITNAPLDFVVAAGSYVFVSTRIASSTETGGIWRVPKGGGAAEPFVSFRYAEQMAVLGDTLYFVVYDDPSNGSTAYGGLWSCPVAGPAPCTPDLIAAGTKTRAMTVDQGKIFYGDRTAGNGLMVYAPPSAPTVFRGSYGFGSEYVVDGAAAFYSVPVVNTSARATVFEIASDATGVTERGYYQTARADDGRLIGNGSALFFTAFDVGGTTGGVVRRIPRGGALTPCDYGGAGNLRPDGVYVDASRIYWMNQGDGAEAPYTNGSLATCDLAGCCATPEILWAGQGQPTGITGDATTLYFVTHAGRSVFAIAKP